MLICAKCGLTLEEDQFHYAVNRQGVWMQYCRKCSVYRGRLPQATWRSPKIEREIWEYLHSENKQDNN